MAWKYAMITRSVLFLILTTNLIVIGLCTMAANYITKRAVYDMDIVRSQYETEIKRYFMNGCMNGTDYPPEYRLPTNEFNKHSPSLYCTDLSKEYEQAILNSVNNIGRTSRDNN